MAVAGADGVEKLEDMIVRSAETTSTHIAAAKAAIGNVIFGQESLVERTLITVLCGGHGMLVGAPLLTIIGVIAVIVAYITRSDAQRTWAASHLTWLIGTFWWSLSWNCIGWVVAVTVIGLPIALAIWIATTIWVIYRVIRGFMYFHRSEPIPGI